MKKYKVQEELDNEDEENGQGFCDNLE